ncbi:GTP-binding protein [bacterium]|nr:GTP-binding protein [bacterium]
MAESRLPVTVLSGFLGSGKTTLLTHLLQHLRNRRVALIVNDMSELNIDARLVEGLRLEKTQARLVEMSNGCICCTLREDLWEQVGELAREGGYDYLLIESTGISEPMPVAATFSFVDENGRSLSEKTRLDTMVTVLDCKSFFEHYFSQDDLCDRLDFGAEAGDQRSLVDLLVDQVEFADVILLNKIDLVQPQELRDIRAVLGKLNPRAELIECSFSQVEPSKVLLTSRFDPVQAEQSAQWSRELLSLTPAEHIPETVEYGISSFVYQARRPFHPERLMEVVQNSMDGILRVKGFFWLASRASQLGYWSQAGSSLRLESKGKWWADLPKESWPSQDDPWILSRWQDPHGDRRQELVMIGADLDRQKVEAALDGCLLTEEEMAAGQAAWSALSDPFPAWS